MNTTSKMHPIVIVSLDRFFHTILKQLLITYLLYLLSSLTRPIKSIFTLHESASHLDKFLINVFQLL